MRSITRILATAALIFASGVATAYAQTATTTLNVTASVAVNCTVTTTPLAFGSYDPVVTNASTPLDGTGAVIVTCTKGGSPTIALNYGSNASGNTRRMRDTGSNYLTYEIYSDAGRTVVWAGAALVPLGAAPSKAPRSAIAYGRVPADQDVPAGNYTDSITATVNF